MVLLNANQCFIKEALSYLPNRNICWHKPFWKAKSYNILKLLHPKQFWYSALRK